MTCFVVVTVGKTELQNGEEKLGLALREYTCTCKSLLHVGRTLPSSPHARIGSPLTRFCGK